MHTQNFTCFLLMLPTDLLFQSPQPLMLHFSPGNLDTVFDDREILVLVLYVSKQTVRNLPYSGSKNGI